MATHDIGYWIGVLWGAALIGGLCGLLPLLVGKSRNNLTLGSVGFVCTLISGLILGVLLAAPVAMVFTLIIALSNRPIQRQ